MSRDAGAAAHLRELLRLKAARSMETLRLYRPLPTQTAFHLSAASERIVRGGNRSGKSACSFAETASAATGIALHDHEGNLMPFRYPKAPLLIWVIGYDERHIGGTIYRMLFTAKSGYRIITDETTGLWRFWNPRDPADKAREAETRPAPPLIPPRLIDPKGWAWTNKAERVFTVCRLKNGTEIHAFSSKAEPKMGDAVDLLHIDEDIKYPGHVAEWQARLSDRRGRLIWSAFPHSANEALTDMSARAEKQLDRAKPDVTEIVLKFSDNPFIDSDEKRKRREGWSEAEVAARDDGAFNTENVLVYPTFSQEVHGIDRRDATENEKALFAAMPNGNIPEDWTRYLAFDPGYTQAAIVFGAVPPPEKFGDYLVIYDELYPRQKNAAQIAEILRKKIEGQRIEGMLIDYRAGRITPLGRTETTRRQYEIALEAEGVICNRSGSNFTYGSDDVLGRIGMVRSGLGIRPDGSTRLKFVCSKLPNTLREFRLYKRKIEGNEVSEKPIDRHDDAMNALEYLVASKPMYVEPAAQKVFLGVAYDEFLKWKAERERAEGSASRTVYFGPGKPETAGVA